jgi:S1-C subfamily serine protease
MTRLNGSVGLNELESVMDINKDDEENSWIPEQSWWTPAGGGQPEEVTAEAPAQWPTGSPLEATEGVTGGRPGPGGEPTTRPLSSRRRYPVLLAAVSLLAAAGAGVGIGIAVEGATAPVTTTANGASPSGGTSTPSGGGTSDPYSGGLFNPGSSSGSTLPVAGSGAPSNVSAIATKVTPGLVDVNSTFSYQRASGAGTGIVLTSSGEVLTNNHVINGATSISVTDLGNGKTYSATVVGYDDTDDVAVLQLQNASGLATASIGSSSTATVGEPIVAIGNAGGTGGTPTSAGGSITGLNQSVTASDELDGLSEQLTGLIGVNADVQPGDSGGPLVNSSGEVLGIDTAGSDGSSTFEFSGQAAASEAYAIPIDNAIAIAKTIESGQGTSTIHVGPAAFLGVMVQASDSGEGGFGGLFGGSGTSATSGVSISGVVAGGTAANAGLVAGDVITSFDGRTIDTSTTLTHLLVPFHPGDKVELGWTDASGASHTATVVLQSGPPA